MCPEDQWQVEYLAAKMFKELREFGSSTLPESAGDFTDLGIKAAERGDPSLVAEYSGAIIVGFCVWTGLGEIMKTDKRELHALGTFVDEKYRREGVADLLRAKAVYLAKSQGYERVCGTVHLANSAGRASLERHGWVANYLGLTKEL